MNHSSLEDKLVQSYQETNYYVYAQPAFFLTIGKQSPELSRLHDKYRVDSSAFITAFNPYSTELEEQQNRERNAMLALLLGELDHSFIEGVGQHLSKQWPGEPSFLVLGVSLDVAKEIGMQFEQNAIVWSGPDAVPELVLLR